MYEKRKDVMFDYIDRIKRLWAGEEVIFEDINGGAVPLRSLPRPVQSALPVWITTAGNPTTWAKAGEIGANIFCALVGSSYDDLAELINLYRKSREENGHDPRTGQVTVMVHTYLGDDASAVKARVREPMCRYLRSYFRQFAGVVQGAERITEEDEMAVVARAFDSYYEHSVLIGTKRKCERVVDRLIDAGADELACLVDFGLDFDAVMEGLGRLAALQDEYARLRRSVALAAPGTERE
jgi:natural product biosynthesis luciferase-like monooxygenase protein